MELKAKNLECSVTRTFDIYQLKAAEKRAICSDVLRKD